MSVVTEIIPFVAALSQNINETSHSESLCCLIKTFTFNAHDALLEYTSSRTVKVERLESLMI